MYLTTMYNPQAESEELSMLFSRCTVKRCFYPVPDTSCNLKFFIHGSHPIGLQSPVSMNELSIRRRSSIQHVGGHDRIAELLVSQRSWRLDLY